MSDTESKIVIRIKELLSEFKKLEKEIEGYPDAFREMLDIIIPDPRIDKDYIMESYKQDNTNAKRAVSMAITALQTNIRHKETIISMKKRIQKLEKELKKYEKVE